MRVEHDVLGGTTLVLSRRNLLTLLAKLDGNPPNSACEIGAPAQYGPFSVKAEEDGEHYFHPERQARGEAGRMHTATEPLVSGESGVDDLGELARAPSVAILNTKHFECLCEGDEHTYPCPHS